MLNGLATRSYPSVTQDLSAATSVGDVESLIAAKIRILTLSGTVSVSPASFILNPSTQDFNAVG